MTFTSNGLVCFRRRLLRRRESEEDVENGDTLVHALLESFHSSCSFSRESNNGSRRSRCDLLDEEGDADDENVKVLREEVVDD